MRAFLPSVLAVSVAALALPAAPAAAQGSDNCRDVLENGTYRVEDVKRDQYLRQLMFSRLKAASYEDATDRQKIGFDVPGYFGGKYSRDKHKAVQSSLENLNFNDTQIRDQSSFYLAGGDPVIVRAWSDCMSNRGGISARFQPLTPTRVLLHLQYHRLKKKTAPVVAKLKSDVKVPVAPINNAECLKSGYELDEEGCVIEFDLPDYRKEFNVTVETLQGNAVAYLPPRVKYDLVSEPYPSKRISELRTEVKHSDVVNGDTPFYRVISMPQDLRTAGWAFDPNSFNVVIIKEGDGRCHSSTATAEGPHRVKLDNRIDINPKDRPAHCVYQLQADVQRLVVGPSGDVSTASPSVPAARAAAVADSSPSAPLAPTHPPAEPESLAQDLPLKPRPGQASPNEKGECATSKQVVLNGVCWIELPSMTTEECSANGLTYRKGRCYSPAFPSP